METAAHLERSMSEQSATSIHSRRSATVRPVRRKLVSQPSSSASSVAPSDKSLTSFPSFSPESPGTERFDERNEARLRTATQQQQQFNRGFRSDSIVVSLTGSAGASAARNSLFEDAPVTTKVPGALHQADDKHIERLIARHGAVDLVRQIAEDLAQRDAQIATIRRRADDREKALRRIIRECGLSNMELETRLRTVESELRESGRARSRVDSELSDMMSDAMKESLAENVYGETGRNGASTLRAANIQANDGGKGTSRGWKDYFWGTGTAKKSQGSGSDVNGEGAHTAAVIRSHSSLERRPGLQDDLFNPPDTEAMTGAKGSSSRPSSIHSANLPDRKGSGSLASLALRLVAGGAISGREAETRGRAVSNSERAASVRAASATNNKRSVQSTRSASVAGGPKALMAMRRSTPAPSAHAAATAKSQAQEMWETMMASPPSALRQESYGPVEMDAIHTPESQPPTLTHIYNNYDNSEFLTDRFGFIYDQRRKRRQREAAQMARHMRKGSRTEMLINGRTGISPNLLDDLPSPKWSVSSDGRPESLNSLEDNDKGGAEEGKPKRWQDYLKIATFPTELLSHTPSMGAPSLEVLEGADVANGKNRAPSESTTTRSPSITPTDSGLVPAASTTTAVDSQVTLPSEPESTPESMVKEDREPVKLLLQQLSELHDTLQSKKTPLWNDFLRKVRAERKREGDAAIAAAHAAAEARYERPAVILPETRVADGEMIGISGLGNKGKVGRAKWNEFKNLVLGGIPVAYRAKIWSECSGAVALRIPGYYEDLVARSNGEDDPSVISQIEMDIHRTLTDNIFFRKGPGVQKLKEVLVAYARRNRDVGYCQGMNLIVANLLLIMPSAEDAFWVLASIVENILPQGYYDHSLQSSRADQQVLRQYVSTVLPKLSAHLDTLSIELETMTFQWFLSVFTDCLCAEALFRVWDVVLCTNDGSTFLFQVALALLKLNEGNLLQCSTPAAVYTYIGHHMTEHAISIDGLMQASEGLRKLVRREDVEQRRDKVLQAEREGLAAREVVVNTAAGDGPVPAAPGAEPRAMEA
ncbi:TBC domain-containing protein-like protein [Hapsidospora chrysogenum ATCC 11550]|uniref:TBC domain-containing protein-like protein n=1 Tax=Hapsidospora chrysogenum (strain ATCC 11550 / CBS 779.69 / DSM 880 / IAM 14645 / JCM 23072 / IMI 49137) TaxID=857340 RepID=A0A086TG94_HAPC1|nr:TBC domain-containing protein-like protein [Hapsidospora chrysogenum ATCC 11550]